MSRIDEALRRAEREESLDGSAVATAIHPAGPPISILERYVPERPADRSATERFVAERSEAVIPPVRPSGERATVVQSPAPHVVERRVPVRPELRGKVVNSAEIDAVSLEQYRRLAAVLDAMQAERGIKCLMVTSAFPREGKTLTATNVAIVLSETYKRNVLLIDADFHRPCVHELLGVPNEFGLADLLRSGDAPLKAARVSSTLSTIPAGHSNGSPIAALSSERMKALIGAATSVYDWVLLDTPPVGLLTDAQLVARVVEGVLFVVAAGGTPYHVVQRTIADLGPDRVIGTVLNRAERRAVASDDYYGDYYKPQP